eukprot:TRINITY_DN7464_c0_g1_i1.p1 TRINITY_DN7464_c0_g1~~TRINITY_DN7464_c0_g1_i1.p1  ORF type:complete len:383 (-),score=15.25 TRINITY_DN7464_c0_g1_i1:133-1197(-)
MLFILLFGESPIFENTPISYVHYLITCGICDGIEYVIFSLCGERGVRFLNRGMEQVMDAMNPILQMTYLVLLFGAFFVYQRYLFIHLPTLYAPAWHMYTGTAAVAVCLTFFWLASFVEPGIITDEDVEKFMDIYKYDELMFVAGKRCNTCEFSKPARSKHCSTCDRCVMRADHHCVWVNNCIGLYNTRWFLGFLGSNCFLAFYGLILDIFITLSLLEQDHGIWTAKFRIPETGELVSVWKYPGKLLEWCAYEYQVPVLMAFFSVVIAVLLAGFNIMHWYLVLTNTTTNEQHKRGVIIKVKRKQDPGQKKKFFWQREKIVVENTYDRGWFENVLEVLFPERFMKRIEVNGRKKET